jgi:hypothetical protein
MSHGGAMSIAWEAQTLSARLGKVGLGERRYRFRRYQQTEGLISSERRDRKPADVVNSWPQVSHDQKCRTSRSLT